MSQDGFATHVSKVAALADPIRRALYHFVAHQPGAISRDQAAKGVEIPRHTAKFHLDKLVDQGLLVTEFRRLTGRTGPGAGRPAKLYRRARSEISVSLPRRRYDLSSHLLADAVTQALGGTPMAEALRAATDRGAAVVVDSWGLNEGTELARMDGILNRLGYEPQIDGDSLNLGNCPFAALSEEHEDLVCPLNRDFVEAVGRELECRELHARSVEPGTGCCVRVEPSHGTITP